MRDANGHPMTVAVVGGGASGALTAAHLLRHPAGNPRVVLIERRDAFGRGVAYSTRSMRHLLNVPADSMSAIADEPEHLVRWLRAGPVPTANPRTFAPRPIFGDYLEDVLDENEGHPDRFLERVRGEAVAIEEQANGAVVRLEDDREVWADRVVLALGNFPPQDPRAGGDSFYGSPRYVPDAWAPGALDGITPDAPVLLIGTSLTAIDVAILLKERGHEAVIHAVSRRGLIPNPYKNSVTSPPYPAFVSPGDPAASTIKSLFRRVREEVRRAEASGLDWHGVVEALRPEAQSLWRDLPEPERRRFLRHVQPFWEAHRHRIAPEVGDEVRAMREDGLLIVAAGRITGYSEIRGGVEARIRPRGGGRERTLRVGHVVNCTAPSMDATSSRHPLVMGLLRDGHARPGPLNIGFDADERGALIGADGEASTVLYTLGSLRKGNLWETIAVPEIRTQAAALADSLLKRFPESWIAQTPRSSSLAGRK